MVDAAPDQPKNKGNKKKPFKININNKLCKGCGICVEFCPTNVLDLKKSKAEVVDFDACICCMFCELRCPDFAITVEEK